MGAFGARVSEARRSLMRPAERPAVPSRSGLMIPRFLPPSLILSNWEWGWNLSPPRWPRHFHLEAEGREGTSL